MSQVKPEEEPLATGLTPSTTVPTALGGGVRRMGDRVFLNLSRGAGVLVLLIMAAIAAFLIWKAIPSLQADSTSFWTTQAWFPDNDPPTFGIAALAFGTFVSSIIAMVIAVPIGIGIALFIAHYAPPRAAATMAFIVDLLAAVPSIIFGLWGLDFLMPRVVPLGTWLNDYLGWIPIFTNTQGIYTKSLLIAGIVLAIMVLPTISAISREVFVQVPHSPSRRLASGTWHGLQTSHHFCVVGSAAIFAMSPAKSFPTYSR